MPNNNSSSNVGIADSVLSGLKKFQKLTAQYVFKRLYDDGDVSRFLVADEVGLGKTMVAKGVIAQALERLNGNSEEEPINIIYICSNAGIAAQNIGKLAKIGETKHVFLNTRLTLLALLKEEKGAKGINTESPQNQGVKFWSMTPGTSLKFNANALGIVQERVLLFHLLKYLEEFKEHEEAVDLTLQGDAYRSWAGHKTNLDINAMIQGEFLNRMNSDIKLTKDYLLLLEEMESHGLKKYERNSPSFHKPGTKEKFSGDKIVEKHFTQARQIIPKLRLNLALASIQSLQTHLLVLDEFQRFHDILYVNENNKNNESNENNEDDTHKLVKEFLGYYKKPEDVPPKILMLSATPYTMYSMKSWDGQDNGVGHQKEFFSVYRFLHNEEDNKTDGKAVELERLFQKHRKGILAFEKGESKTSEYNQKREIEKLLREVMCRTERVRWDEPPMFQEKPIPVSITPVDLLAAKFVTKISKKLGLGNMIEYWKSIPYPVNFMRDDNYKLGKKLISDKPEDSITWSEFSSMKEHKLVLDRAQLEKYNPLKIPHPKMRAFLEMVLGENVNQIPNDQAPSDQILSDQAKKKKRSKGKKGPWQLLWMPPSLPYYTPKSGSAFEGQGDLTKTLVFSSWKAVPDAIASLCCYEAQVKMFKLTKKEQKDFSEVVSGAKCFQSKQRALFTRKQKSKQEKSLKARAWGGKESKPLLLLGWSYPSLVLATKIDPFRFAMENNGKPLSYEELRRKTLAQCKKWVNILEQRLQQSGTKPDARWYWLAPILLDHIFAIQTVQMDVYRTVKKVNGLKSNADEDRQNRLLNFEEILSSEFFNLHLLSNSSERLGKLPDNLADVLCDLALGGPGTCALRALMRIHPNPSQCESIESSDPKYPWEFLQPEELPDPEELVELLQGAAQIAVGFHFLYNTPEAMSLLKVWKYLPKNNKQREAMSLPKVRKHPSKKIPPHERYWRETLRYGINGNLQSLLDEYVHFLHEQFGPDVPKIANEIHGALTLSPSKVEIRTFKNSNGKCEVEKRKSKKANGKNQKAKEKNQKNEQRTFRVSGRYAERLLDAKTDEADRQTSVKIAFNSPFRPFVLATTSIGQEGLDFHPWCHSVVHWNLPSNPVDFEQREGRVQRYKGHAVRKNIARRFSLAELAKEHKNSGNRDPWQTLFNMAKDEIAKTNGDDFDGMAPFWIFLNENTECSRIERRTFQLPLSRDESRLSRLKDDLRLYRMTFGQPNQEDLLNNLREKQIDTDEVNEWIFSLKPPKCC